VHVERSVWIRTGRLEVRVWLYAVERNPHGLPGVGLKRHEGRVGDTIPIEKRHREGDGVIGLDPEAND
jgi:hypothetical protein